MEGVETRPVIHLGGGWRLYPVFESQTGHWLGHLLARNPHRPLACLVSRIVEEPECGWPLGREGCWASGAMLNHYRPGEN